MTSGTSTALWYQKRYRQLGPPTPGHCRGGDGGIRPLTGRLFKNPASGRLGYVPGATLGRDTLMAMSDFNRPEDVGQPASGPGPATPTPPTTPSTPVTPTTSETPATAEM